MTTLQLLMVDAPWTSDLIQTRNGGNNVTINVPVLDGRRALFMSACEWYYMCCLIEPAVWSGAVVFVMSDDRQYLWSRLTKITHERISYQVSWRSYWASREEFATENECHSGTY